MFNLKAYFEEQRSLIDTAIDKLMPHENTPPSVLHNAMRYSTFSGGKRIRPILCMTAASALGRDHECAVLPAIAVEILHTYTLVHDDLPCMDDDDLRRGKPTTHKVFGEANAVLVGDALQALAFEIISTAKVPENYPPHQLVHELACAAGSRGVVGGQVEDIRLTGKHPTMEEISFVHLHKTADMFRTALRLGAISANADNKQLEALSTYGTNLGLAFQITDDILDMENKKQDELSCLMIYDTPTAQNKACELISNAKSALDILEEENTGPLLAIADFVMERKL